MGSAASPATRPWRSLIALRPLISTLISAAGVPWRAAWLSTRCELAAELARVGKTGQRIAAGILLELADLGARVGQSGAQQRILVGQPRSASRASRVSGSARCRLGAGLRASHAARL